MRQNKKKLFFLITILLSLLLAGCKTSSKVPETPTGIDKFIIAPRKTNPILTDHLSNYYVFQPTQTNAKEKLFIFLPGSLVSPKIYQELLLTGAENGYYSIGFSYQNGRLLTSRCRGKDSGCRGRVAQELLQGKDVSNAIQVDSSSSIERRLIALIKYLQKQHPQNGWSQFIKNGKIQWNKITIAGHSQGSNIAAYIGWHRSVVRVGMFSGPYGLTHNDDSDAPWLKDNRLTSASKFYGFANLNDHISNFENVESGWKSLGLKDSVISVDDADPSWKNSHQLSTEVGGTSTFNGGHGSTCVDTQTPHDEEGNPIFKKIWRYMLFP